MPRTRSVYTKFKWSHTRRTLSLPSTVHNFRPQISLYNHFRRHFTPTILIHCLRMNELKKFCLLSDFSDNFLQVPSSMNSNVQLFYLFFLCHRCRRCRLRCLSSLDSHLLNAWETGYMRWFHWPLNLVFIRFIITTRVETPTITVMNISKYCSLECIEPSICT